MNQTNWKKIFIWVLGGIATSYFFDVYLREKLAAMNARKRADELGKPLLNVGSGTHESSFTGAKIRGDVNCDLAAPKGASCGKETVCFCDVQDLSKFKNKQFGVVLAANVMRYVPDKTKALRELHRIADEVIISDNLIPWPQLGPGPKFPV